MTGGMEDDERARRRRGEELQWEKEEALRRRKELYRNERNDRKRGHWAIEEPLTEKESEWMRALKSNYDLWHAVHDPVSERDEWEPRDAHDKWWYDKLSKTQKDHEGSVHYARTQIPPEEYYKRRFEINKGGLGFIGVRYERESQMDSISQESGFPVTSNT